jgi:creatinine amidohydrolase
MPRASLLLTLTAVLLSTSVSAADKPADKPLPVRWDELTASDWPKAMAASKETCLLPFGVLEKHGLHSPIGTDIIKVREETQRVAQREYAVVFPDYIYGQINEAKHQPGTFALPPRLVGDLLEATLDEIGRNGFKRIVIVNGHGGNPYLITYVLQSLLSKRRPYAVYYFNNPEDDPAFDAKIEKMQKSDPALNMHAGEEETARMMYLRPELMQMERAQGESGADQKRNALPSDVYTPIWWYARFPNHYSGEGHKATRELGEALEEHRIARLAAVLKIIKADTQTLAVQDEFFDRVDAMEKKK